MITTVTLNPSLDLTLEVESLSVGGVSRALRERLEAAGKGVNVSRALAAHGIPTRAIAAIDPAAAPRYRELLDVDDVLVAVPVSGMLRTNVAIVEPAGIVTKVNGPGPVHTAASAAAMLEGVVAAIHGSAWVVLSGSLPPGCPGSAYAELITAARASGCRVALDSEGIPLRLGIAAGPDLVKPNRAELEEAVGTPITTVGDAVNAARRLVLSGAGAVLCSLGPDGAMFVSSSQAVHASVPALEIESNVGAGDALLAGFLAGSGAPESALRQAVMWATAACRLPGTGMPGPDDVNAQEVRVVETPVMPARLLTSPTAAGVTQ